MDKTLTRLLNAILTLIALAVLLVVILMFVPINYTVAKNPVDYEEVVRLYAEIKETPLSYNNDHKVESIIKERLVCYDQAESFMQRDNECYTRYATEIVAFSLANIRSNPLLGHFLSRVKVCPVAYSICRGTDQLSIDKCIDVEQQCLDYMLDKYWRGNNHTFEF